MCIRDRDDIDGLYYMLDRDFSGCLLLNFAKPMNPEIQGRAWLNGEMLPPCVLKYMPIMGNLWVLGIPMRGFVNEYGKEYSCLLYTSCRDLQYTTAFAVGERICKFGFA